MTLSLGVCTTLLICGPLLQEQTSNDFVAAKPSPEHAILKKDVGTWDIDITMGSGAAKAQSKGTETVRMLGSFWSISDMKYDYMGQPVQSHGTIGYDPDKKRFVGSWHESSSPNLTTMTGKWDAKTNKLTMIMKGKDPAGKNTRFKSITTYIDENTKTFEFFMLKEGSKTEFMKAMEMKYSRRKDVTPPSK